MADAKKDGGDGGKAKGGGKVIIVGFISVIMLVETALFFFLVPSAEEVAALAEARLIQNVQKSEEDQTQAEIDENAINEFELGSFGETFSPIDTEQKYRVELTLFALVKAKDQPKLESEFKEKSGRLSHAIRMKIRNSELSELEENQLGLLQRRILATCNHLLENDILLSIGFRDYQVTPE
jgi:flagellar basal body-associated protein FliL